MTEQSQVITTPAIDETVSSDVAAPTVLTVEFGDVSVKDDGSFVVTVASNRCHVTRDYNPSLYEAIESFLNNGGDYSKYAEDIVVESDPLVLARLWIDTQLKSSENIVSQYRDARDLGTTLPITPAQFAELLAWRQAVREWPQVAGYPSDETQPSAPGWINAHDE
ncbi:hypothetical protein [Pseudomonas frederiksbergensis]|uniref:Phage tail protein n=1 Tax=Pseudomonas frederiksbergensis TaxID=104087 RepID=A0A6L5C117_9PSED|nr:hypothetical protein [Pseudomonas frederiksbergensis]KAF2393154.1 hypothetical protein FX983_01115 [Pseudomonas frederiksbergensis]